MTKIGKQQHYALGQYLRKRYAKLLGNGDYSADKVYVHSTVRYQNEKFNANKMSSNLLYIFVL